MVERDFFLRIHDHFQIKKIYVTRRVTRREIENYLSFYPEVPLSLNLKFVRLVCSVSFKWI
jgi:hypothetical protein